MDHRADYPETSEGVADQHSRGYTPSTPCRAEITYFNPASREVNWANRTLKHSAMVDCEFHGILADSSSRTGHVHGF